MAGPAQHNLEMVLDGWVEALRRDDLAAVERILAPDVVWRGVVPTLGCQGRDEVLATIRAGRPERPEIAGVEIRTAGQRVLVGFSSPGFTQVAGEPLAGAIFDVFTIEDGLVVTIDEFKTRAEADAALHGRETGPAALPDGFLLGHWTHPQGITGCTVVLAPEGAVGGVEVRGGGPGTRETDVLSPASMAREAHGVVLAGGSAFGLACADGVVSWLEERGHGHLTRAGVRVPIVPGAVVFDGGALTPGERPGAAEGRAACDAATAGVVQRGRIGVGASVAAGKAAGLERMMLTGFGAAADSLGGATLTALAVANPVGEVVAADGTVLAGVRGPDGFERSTDLLRAGTGLTSPAREATTLVVLVTDARLDRTGAWLVARSASAGVARAVHPTATAYDGDVAFCLARGEIDVDPFALQAVAADVVAAAVRDAAVP